MKRRCEPLFRGDTGVQGKGFCGVMFDPEKRFSVCPHLLHDESDAPHGLRTEPRPWDIVTNSPIGAK